MLLTETLILNINFTTANTKCSLSYIIIVLIVICYLMKKKFLHLKSTVKMKTFQLNFVSQMHMIFQSIKTLLTSLRFISI